MKNLYLLILAFATMSAFAQTVPTKISGRGDAIAALPFDASLKPFYHGVASGDPLEDRVIIWTRVTPDDIAAVKVDWTLATDTAFTKIVKTGTTTTDIEKDYTVKIDVTGLLANTTYYYYFTAQGKNSIIGRTKTTPQATQSINNLKFAVVSCSNYEGGLFTAYSRIADRNDLDAVVFLGDYIYEYSTGGYKNLSPELKRIVEPATEILTISDYRTRYSLYKLDKDLMRAHQQHPFIAIWDDHESANDSYFDGAENHTEGAEGLWTIRKAISKKVYYEWMPIRNTADDKLYRAFSYGTLADLIMLDTRLEGREKPPIHFDSPDVPARKMISQTQYDWFINNLKKSKAKWKVIGNQVMFSTYNVGFAAGFADGKPDVTNIDSIRASEDLFIDNWESYPTQRNSIIDTLQKNNIKNVIFVTGDSHCSWAFDVTKQAVLYPFAGAMNIPQPIPYNAANGSGYNAVTGEGSYAVEFGTPSISSQNFDEAVGAAASAQFELTFNNPIPQLGNANYNPHLKYVDLDQHGYMILDLKSDSAQTDFFHVPNVTSLTTTETRSKGVSVKSNQTKIAGKSNAMMAPAKSTQEIPAPAKPKGGISGNEEGLAGQIFTLYPNPANDKIMLSYALNLQTTAEIKIIDAKNTVVKILSKASTQAPGVYQMDYDISDIKAGIYFLIITTDKTNLTKKLVIK